MRGPKWLQRLNEQEQLQFDLMEYRAEILAEGTHYMAGPGTDHIYMEEDWVYSSGQTIRVSSGLSHAGPKPSWLKHCTR